MDQTLVTSGFDVELLIGARYIQYILLSFSETGSFPLRQEFGGGQFDIFQPGDVDRLYEPHPDAVPLTASNASFTAELLFNHHSGANVMIDLEVGIPDEHVFAYSSFGLAFDTDAQGRQINHRIELAVLALELTNGLRELVVAQHISDAQLLAKVKEQADRAVPLPFASEGQNIERIEMLQLPSMDGGPVAIGFYLNLALRDGPESDSLLDLRGDVFQAMNFLEDGQDIAFATRPGLLDDMAANLKFTFAEETAPGSGEYRYPMRRDMYDKTSEEIGKLISISLKPGRDQNNLLTGEIQVVIRGEYYVDNFFDPDFTFTLTLVPNFADGVVTWSHRTDLDSTLGEVLSFLVLGFVGLLVFGIASDVVADSVIDDAQRKQMTTFLSALPVRVLVEPLRWDPFYTTNHQVVARVDTWLVNDTGIAFCGRAALGKETEPVAHVVLRTEVRDSQNAIIGLDYRVRDQARHAEWLDPTNVQSATDRLESAQEAGDPILFRLTANQAMERLAAKKIASPMPLIPTKVHLDEHKVFRMLCITPLEIDEQASSVINRFRNSTRASILAEQGDMLRDEIRIELENELGMSPTSEQVEERLSQRLDAMVATAEADYRDHGQYVLDLQSAVDAILLLDMAPDDYGQLQQQGILNIVGYDLIVRHNRKFRPGTTIRYYRDRADFEPRDNLLNMRKYAIDHTP
jgi:hypothetical protein